MEQILNKTFFIFCFILELLIILDIYIGLLPTRKQYHLKFHFKVEPLLRPVRYLLKYSFFNTKSIDLGPYITIMVLVFIQVLILFKQ